MQKIMMPSALSLKNTTPVQTVGVKKDKRSYAPEFRFVVLEEVAKQGVRATAREFKVSEATIYDWKKKRKEGFRKPVLTAAPAAIVTKARETLDVVQKATEMLQREAAALEAELVTLAERAATIETKRNQIQQMLGGGDHKRFFTAPETRNQDAGASVSPILAEAIPA